MRRPKAPWAVALALLTAASCARLKPRAAGEPVCRADLEAAIGLVSRNYAGWDDKRAARGDTIAAATISARAAADAVDNSDACSQVLEDWIAALADGHVGLRPRSARNQRVEESSGGHRDRPSTLSIPDGGPALLMLPSFAASEEPRILSLLEKSRRDLVGAPLLVLDVRGNGGGSDASWSALLPFVATGPITSVGADVLNTPENADAQAWIVATQLPKDSPVRQKLSDRIASMREATSQDPEAPPPPRRGPWLRWADDGTINPVLAGGPARVAVVVDSRCVSACEQFLLAARQSRKVTLIGTNSGGVLDYANVVVFSLPSGRRVVQLPTTRTRRTTRIDNEGIPPDVAIDQKELASLEGVALVARVERLLEQVPPASLAR